MKKAFMTICIVILLCSYVFANGGEDVEEDGVTTLSVYYYLDLSDETATANWNEILAAWEVAHPEIKLTFEYQSNEPFHNKLQAMAVSGQIPDVVWLWPYKRTGYVTRSGLIKDIKERIAPHKDKFTPAALTDQGPNGEIYEIPEQITITNVMYSNTKILDELGLDYPETLEELLAQGEVIRAAGYIPIAMDNGDGWQMQSCLLSTLVERAGGMDWYNDVLTDKASWSDPEFVNALNVIKTLSDANMFSPGINQAGYGVALDNFNNGEAVYMIDGGWRVNALVKEMDSSMKPYIELNAFPDIPNQKGSSGSTSVVPGTGFGMNANLSADKADAAWEFIWFSSGPDGAAIRATQGYIPSYKMEIEGNDPLLDKLVDFANAVPTGYVIDSVVDSEGMSILHPDIQEMMFGNKTPQQVADNFEAWVDANDSTRNP